MPTPIKKKSVAQIKKSPPRGFRGFPDVTTASAWLRTHKQLLNLSEVCRLLAIDNATMSKIVNNVRDARGHEVKLPRRTLGGMNELYKELTAIHTH
jgi:hypothetical protein